MSWSKEQVSVLINKYKKHPCLYAVKNKLYSNKHARNLALSSVVEVVKTIKPAVTVLDVKTKFVGLKSTFLSEHRKHMKSLGTGTGEDEVYQPSLWYYKDMFFMLDSLEIRESQDTLSFTTHWSDEHDTEELDDHNSQNEQYAISITDGEFEQVDPVPLINTQLQSQSSTSSSSSGSITTKGKKRRRTASGSPTDVEVSQEATAALQQQTNHVKQVPHVPPAPATENETLGQFIVSKLDQSSDDNIRLDVEQQIITILYSGIKHSREVKSD